MTESNSPQTGKERFAPLDAVLWARMQVLIARHDADYLEKKADASLARPFYQQVRACIVWGACFPLDDLENAEAVARSRAFRRNYALFLRLVYKGCVRRGEWKPL